MTRAPSACRARGASADDDEIDDEDESSPLA
jgi:hypothetical protein